MMLLLMITLALPLARPSRLGRYYLRPGLLPLLVADPAAVLVLYGAVPIP